MPVSWESELHQAVSQENHQLVRRLLQSEEVRLELPGKSEWDWGAEEAPVHLAAFVGQTEVVKMFVMSGCNINSYAVHANGDRETVIHCAMRWRKFKLLRKMDNKEKYMQQRYDIQFKRQRQTEIVKFLVEEGADLSLKGTFSDYEDCYLRRPLMGTPLDYAKQVRNAPLIRFLALEPETLPWMHKGHLCLIM